MAKEVEGKKIGAAAGGGDGSFDTGTAHGGGGGEASVEVEQAVVDAAVSQMGLLEELLRKGLALLARSLLQLSQNAEQEAALDTPLPDRVWGRASFPVSPAAGCLRPVACRALPPVAPAACARCRLLLSCKPVVCWLSL